MRSHFWLAAALIGRTLAEPIPARSSDEDDSKKKAVDESTAATDVTVSETPVVVVTLVVTALTTTFTPPPECAESRLTQLASPGYQIWLHEPMPVGGTTVKDCYPSEFINNYASVANTSSSVAPLMSPLVCPKGWHTAFEGDNGYIACCADGYLLTPPDPKKFKVDPKRPAYGGTCYSQFTVGKTVTITAWDNVKPTATVDWVASQSNDAAYGHVMDGFAVKATSTPSAASSETQPPQTGAPASDDGSNEEKSRGLTGGAIAGIVVGSVAGIALIVLGAFFFVRRRAKDQQGHEQIGGSRDQPSQQTEHLDDNGKPLPNIYALKDNPGGDESIYSKGAAHGHTGADGRSEVTGTTSPPMTVVSPVSELGGQQRHELGTTEYAELDGGYHRHEL